MSTRRLKARQVADHLVLSFGVVLMCTPLVIVFVAATGSSGVSDLDGVLNGAGTSLGANFKRLSGLLERSGSAPELTNMLTTSVIVALGVAVLTTAISYLAAYSVVFLKSRVARLVFWISLATLFFPIEARMLATFEVTHSLGLLSSYAGLILPVLALALGILIFTHHLRRLPPDLLGAARLDGAGPFRFLVDFALPLSRAPVAAVFLVTFVAGWNQYLWPLVVSVDDRHWTMMRGLEMVGGASAPGALLASISMLPPLLLVLVFQRFAFQVARAGPD